MVAALAVAALLALAAAPAQAAPQWVYGLSLESKELSCYSHANPGTNLYETNVMTRAGILVDPQSPPRVGDVFYAAVQIGQVAGCYEDSVRPEAIPPLGVELAASAATPVRCHYTPWGGTLTPIPPPDCPSAPGTGLFGGLALTPRGDPTTVWQLAPRELFVIEFPLRASRPLTSLLGGPSCPARADRRGPCPRESAGDFLQVAVRVADNGASPTLTPAIGLAVQPAAGGDAPAGGAGPPVAAPRPEAAAQLAVRVPRSLRLRRALRGIPITVTVPANDARVVVTLTARGRRIAVHRRSGVRAGRLHVRLRPTRRAARRLRRARGVTATLRVTVHARGRPAAVATSRIRLRG